MATVQDLADDIKVLLGNRTDIDQHSVIWARDAITTVWNIHPWLNIIAVDVNDVEPDEAGLVTVDIPDDIETPTEVGVLLESGDYIPMHRTNKEIVFSSSEKLTYPTSGMEWTVVGNSIWVWPLFDLPEDVTLTFRVVGVRVLPDLEPDDDIPFANTFLPALRAFGAAFGNIYLQKAEAAATLRALGTMLSTPVVGPEMKGATTGHRGLRPYSGG